MSSTSSATLTRAPDPVRRRLRASTVFRLLCVAGALIYVIISWPRAQAERWADQRQLDLVVTGAVMDAVEEHLADDEALTVANLSSSLTPFFTTEPSLAAIRIRDLHGNGLGTALRQRRNGAAVTLGDALPDFASAIPNPPSTQLADDVSELNEAYTEQQAVSDGLADLLAASRISGTARSDVYAKQSEALDYVKTLAPRFPQVNDAIPAMNDVLDRVTSDALDDLSTAQESADEAVETISLALEDCRTGAATHTALPAALRGTAARPATMWGYLWPFPGGRLLRAPIFVPAGTDTLNAPVGWVDVVFYDYPADAIPALGWPGAILGVVLALVLITALPRRRRRPRYLEELAPHAGDDAGAW